MFEVLLTLAVIAIVAWSIFQILPAHRTFARRTCLSSGRSIYGRGPRGRKKIHTVFGI